MKTYFLDLLCLAVLCVLLTLGLWPFHSPENTVVWLNNRNGIRFGRHGSAASSSTFQTMSAEGGDSATIEIWVKPRKIWNHGTLLASCTHGNLHQLSLRQSMADLELKAASCCNTGDTTAAKLYVKTAFRPTLPVFLTITSGAHGTAVYTDGVLAKTAPEFRFSTENFVGRLILGDSPGQPDNWLGEFWGLAIYSQELGTSQVVRHYLTWTQSGKPEISEGERNIALYLFGERAGNVIRNEVKSGVNLHIPDKYMVWEKLLLEPFWKEFSTSWAYWDTFPKNIIGFIPLGICFCASLSARKIRRVAFVTVVLGALVSLTIEILQGYLPTRDSGTTDIISNSLGTYIGVITWRVASPVLAVRFPWLPLGLPLHKSTRP